jgi:hypothetical protein
MGSPRPSLESPRRSLGSPRRSLGSPRCSLGSPRRSLGSPSRPLASPRRHLGLPRCQLRSPRRHLGWPRCPLGSPRCPMGSAERPLRSPRCHLESPRRPGMTLAPGHDACACACPTPPNAKYHRHGCHTMATSSRSNHLVARGPTGPSVGVSPIWGPKAIIYGLPLCLVCRPGGRGGGVGCMGFGSWVSPDRMLFAGPRHSVSITPGRQRRVQPWT